MKKEKNKKCGVAVQRNRRQSKARGKGRERSAKAKAKERQARIGIEPKANLHYKDTVFRMLFRDKERLLGLYNAVGGRNYTDADELEIVTLESAVYMGVKNDLAFLIDLNLYLFEHQSTLNPNMPLRFLQYVSAEYEKLLVSENLYGETLVQVPAPHFVVFYNGTRPCKEYQELRLSSAFRTVEKNPQLELWIQVLNINAGFNEKLKEQCRTLKEYMLYVEKIRSYAKEMPIDGAVNLATDECIREGVLRDFLLENKAEVTKMSIFEYDEEAVRRVLKKEAYENGYTEGHIEGYAEGRKKGHAKGRKEGRAEEIIEIGFDLGWPEQKILSRLQDRLGISSEKAAEYLAL